MTLFDIIDIQLARLYVTELFGITYG